MSINGINNNFNPTIDGLTAFNLDDIVCNSIVVNGSITLPNNSILDQYLTTNIPKKNQNNTFSGLNTYNGGLSVSSSLTLYNNAIIDSYLSSNVPLKDANNVYSGVNDFNASVNINGGQYLGLTDFTATYGTYFGQNGTTLEITNYGDKILITTTEFDLTNTYTTLKGGTNVSSFPTYLPYTDGINYISGETHLRVGDVIIDDGTLYCYNGINITGSVTLPNNSISDSALSNNVCLLTATQTLTNKTLTSPIISTIINTGTLTLPTTTTTLVGRTTTDTLTNKTLTSPIISTIINTGTLTLPTTTTTLVGRTTTDTLTNKTLTSPIISTIINTGTLTLPTTTTTLVGRTTTDTLTNKTLTDPTITNTLQFTNSTSVQQLVLYELNATIPSYNYTISVEPNYMRYNITSGGVNHHLFSRGLGTSVYSDIALLDSLGITIANGNLIFSNAGTIVNTTGNVLTLPITTDTFVCRNTTDTLTNKTLTSPKISTIINTGTLTLPTTTTTLVGRNTTDTLSNKTIDATNTINDGALSSNVPLKNSSNIFTNTNTFTGELTLQSNTNLPTSTFTTPTTGQLGYTLIGTKTTAGIPFTYSTPSSVFTLASISLPYGVWNVIGQLAYEVNTAGTMPLVERYSISKFPSGSIGNIDEQCLELQEKFNITAGYIYTKRMNTIITSTTSSTNIYLNLRLDFLISGSYQITNTSQSNLVNFYAVRIA